MRGGLQDLFAGRQVERLNSLRLGGSRPQSRAGSRAASPPKVAPAVALRGAGGTGQEGFPGMPPAPGPNPGGYVKVQQAPRFKGQTYSAYITWEVQFEYWARMRRLWDIYLGLVEAPVLTGYTQELLRQHAMAMQEYVTNREWAYGELVQALQLDEHVQLVLEFKGDAETPQWPSGTGPPTSGRGTVRCTGRSSPRNGWGAFCLRSLTHGRTSPPSSPSCCPS